MKFKKIIDIYSRKIIEISIFLGAFIFSNDLFALVSVQVLNNSSDEISRIKPGAANNNRKFINAINLVEQAFSKTQKDDNIKIAALTLLATMIQNLERVSIKAKFSNGRSLYKNKNIRKAIFYASIYFVKQAFKEQQRNDDIKVAGLNLLTNMIKKLEKIAKNEKFISDNGTKNIRSEIILNSIKLSREIFGVQYNQDNHSYYYNHAKYNESIKVRIAAMELLIGLKQNINDLIYYKGKKRSIKDLKNYVLRSISYIVASIFALPLFMEDDSNGRIKDNNKDIKIMAVKLMTFINNKFDNITGQGAGSIKQHIIDNTQTIIEKAHKGGLFWNSNIVKEDVALLEASSLKNIEDNLVDRNDVSEITGNLMDALETIPDQPKFISSNFSSKVKEKFEDNIFKAIVPQEDNDEAREFSEKVAAEFAQKSLKQLSGSRKLIEFKRVFSNLKDSIVAGFKSSNGSIGGINYDALPLNISYTKYKGTTLQRFLLVIKLFDHGKLTDKGLRSAIAQLVSEWKRRRILGK